MVKISKTLFFLGLSILYVNASINVCLHLKKSKNDKLISETIVNSGKVIDNGTVFYDIFPILINHPAVSFDGQFKNLTVSNLNITTKTILQLQNDQLKLVNLTFTNVTFEADYYNLTGNIGQLFDVFGQGNFWAKAYDFSISFSILAINLNTTDLCIPVSVDVDLQKIDVNFANIMNNDPELCPLFNAAFCAILPDIIRGVWQEVKDGNEARLEKIINDLINSLLSMDEDLRIIIENYIKQKLIDLEHSV